MRSWTIVFLLIGPLSLQAQTLERRIEDAVSAAVAKQKVPGAAVAVLRGDQIVIARGFGLASVEHRVPVTTETMFQSGSVGKQFTAAGVMLLVDDGKLALEDPVTKHLPDAPASWSNITIRHLLTHTSGIPDYTSNAVDYRRDYTEEELAQMAFRLKREFAPGARWNYSNTGYALLGMIMRAASGRFYGDFLRERLFVPAGMRTARVISEQEIVPNRASGYQLVDGQLRNQDWVSPSLNTTADGSLYVSLNDMMSWALAVRRRGVLSGATWNRMLEPVRLNSGNAWTYGFGFDLAPVNGHARVHHGGAWQGFKSYITRFVEDDVTVIVLANLANADAEELAGAAAAVMNAGYVERPLAPIEDRDPAATARVMAILETARAGEMDPAAFAYVRAGFFPGAVKGFQKRLNELGRVTLILLRRQQMGDDTVSTYEVKGERGSSRLTIAVAPDGRIAQFRLR